MFKIEKLESIFKNFNKPPVLFIGAGLSRRYLGLGNWEMLLREMAALTKDNELAFEQYKRKAVNSGYKVGEFQKIAELIENDLSDLWFEADKFKDSRDKYKNLAKQGISPLKIEIAKYIEESSLNINPDYSEEIDLLRKLGKKSIASIITTNYDTFLEETFKNYKSFVGQEELILSNLQGVGEIYKIHGSITSPDSIIINEKDYIEFEEKNSYLAAKILTIFLEHPIIFLGYSIGDEDIKNILKSIVKCLSKEKLDKLKKRLVFVEWNNTDEEDKISDYSISFEDGKTLYMTRLYIKDFSLLYSTLLKNKYGYNTTVLRRLKEEIYELVASNEPTSKMKVVNIEDDDNLDQVEFVMGVGVISDFGKKGYSGIKVKELFEDVLFDDKDFNNDMIVAESLPILIKQNKGSVPIYKYISQCGCKIHDVVRNEIKDKFEDLLSRTIRNNRSKHDYSQKTLNEIIDENEDSKVLSIVPLLNEENIDIKSLGEFLKNYYTNNPDVFTSSTKSDFRRLVKIYDWLKYYQKYKEKES